MPSAAGKRQSNRVKLDPRSVFREDDSVFKQPGPALPGGPFAFVSLLSVLDYRKSDQPPSSFLALLEAQPGGGGGFMRTCLLYRFAGIAGFLFSLIFALTAPAQAGQFYAAPGGAPHNDGSHERPWDIVTAFAHPETVVPGDTIWLLGGRYPIKETLISSLQGEAGAPIIVRQAPDERATIDCADAMRGRTGGDCLLLRSHDSWYWGFEVMNSNSVRHVGTAGSQADPRGVGIRSEAGTGTKLINLIVHDVGTTLFESQSSGIEISGMIAFNSGWDGPDRSHGPGFYIRNRPGWPTKVLRDNILFQHYRQAIQGFGSFDNVFSNFVVEGNIVFNNGIGADGFHRNLMFGNPNGGHLNNAFLDNYTSYPPTGNRGSNMFASEEGGCQGLLLSGNVFAHGPDREAIEINRCVDVVIQDNFFQGRTVLRESDPLAEITGPAFEQRFPDNRYETEPTGSLVRVRPNPYEPNRAHIIVYNWDERCEIDVDLSNLTIPPGARYELRNVQDYFGEPLSGIYRGRALSIPMHGWVPAKPAGDFERALPEALPRFGAFVLTWRVKPWTERRGGLSRFSTSSRSRVQPGTCTVPTSSAE